MSRERWVTAVVAVKWNVMKAVNSVDAPAVAECGWWEWLMASAPSMGSILFHRRACSLRAYIL